MESYNIYSYIKVIYKRQAELEIQIYRPPLYIFVHQSVNSLNLLTFISSNGLSLKLFREEVGHDWF